MDETKPFTSEPNVLIINFGRISPDNIDTAWQKNAENKFFLLFITILQTNFSLGILV